MESYSLWVLPPTKTALQIRALQTDCRDVLGGPEIIPHITVAGGIFAQKDKFLDACENLVPSIAGAQVKSEGIAIDQPFFRSIFLKVCVDEKIRAVRSSLYETFDVNAPQYFPHSSLYYGHTEERAKTEVVEALQSISFEFNAAELALASNDEINLRWKILHTFSV